MKNFRLYFYVMFALCIAVAILQFFEHSNLWDYILGIVAAIFGVAGIVLYFIESKKS